MGNQHPLAFYHENFGPRSAKLLDPGTSAAQLGFYWSSTLNRKRSSYIIDGETRVLQLNLRHGINKDWQIDAVLPLVWQGGGIADSAIDRWHRIFGLPRGGRNRVENDSFSVTGNLEGPGSLDLDPESAALGDITLTPRYRLYSNAETNAALEGILRLPTAQTSERQQSIDAGASLLASRRFSRLEATIGLNYLRYFDRTLQNLRFQSDHYSGFVGAEYALMSSWSIFTNFSIESALVSNLRHFPDYSLYWDYGHTFSLAKDVALRAGFRENLGPSVGTVDFSFMLELETRL